MFSNKISRTYSWLCFMWLVFAQILITFNALWRVESDDRRVLFGSRFLDTLLGISMYISFICAIALIIFGLASLLAVLFKYRKIKQPGLFSIYSFVGLGLIVLAIPSALLMADVDDLYCPPPSIEQLFPVFIVVLFDVVILKWMLKYLRSETTE